MMNLHPPSSGPLALPCARPAERQTVVLLHASASSGRQWDALGERLRPRFDVVAIDLHGHGHQEAWADDRAMSLDDEASLVLPVLKRAGAAHLIGHSYGGAVAMHVACRHPHLVRSLAVYEPVLFRLLADHEPQGAAIRAGLEAFSLIGFLMDGGCTTEAARTFVDYWSGPHAWDSLPPQLQRPVLASMASVCQQFHVVCDESLPSERLAGLTMASLCLSGSRTTAATARIAQLLQALMPAAQHLQLPGMGHMGPVTHAAAVNDQLAAFLDLHAHSACGPR
ncbi:MAG: alpha/beta hydrolase [Burkholderiaceae bacterium]|nr:alpha/beta hydrolase [Burkholderiaceae bacterium]